MFYPQEFCPKCQAITNLSVSLSMQKAKEGKGDDQEILLLNYHCVLCHTLVCQSRISGDLVKQTSGSLERWPSSLRA